MDVPQGPSLSLFVVNAQVVTHCLLAVRCDSVVRPRVLRFMGLESYGSSENNFVLI